jgi:hypothetical protein
MRAPRLKINAKKKVFLLFVIRKYTSPYFSPSRLADISEVAVLNVAIYITRPIQY